MISIHALREESDPQAPSPSSDDRAISIHALREESDAPAHVSAHVVDISIHALREESDALAAAVDERGAGFQSTLSVRRATVSNRSLRCPAGGFQSTLSVRRATLPRVGQGDDAFRISIHALREESDMGLCCSRIGRCDFNPRSP